MEAKNVKLADRIYRNKEKLDIINERMKVLEEEFAEIRKKVDDLKDMDDEKIVMEAERTAEFEDEYDRFDKELGISIERQKVLVEELAELFKEMKIGGGDGE